MAKFIALPEDHDLFTGRAFSGPRVTITAGEGVDLLNASLLRGEVGQYLGVRILCTAKPWAWRRVPETPLERKKDAQARQAAALKHVKRQTCRAAARWS